MESRGDRFHTMLGLLQDLSEDHELFKDMLKSEVEGEFPSLNNTELYFISNEGQNHVSQLIADRDAAQKAQELISPKS